MLLVFVAFFPSILTVTGSGYYGFESPFRICTRNFNLTFFSSLSVEVKINRLTIV